MHKIIFDQVETGWHNALPLGNGRMGAMVFFRDNTIHLALNHYDCYYQNLYTRRKQTEKVPGERYRQLCEIAENTKRKWNGAIIIRHCAPKPEKSGPSLRERAIPWEGKCCLASRKK